MITDVDIQDNQHYYYQIMRKTIVQFLDQFNKIKIARYDTQSGELLSYVKIPLKFAPKTKHYYWTEKIDSNGERIRDKILPMMAVNLTNVELDSNRKVNNDFRGKTNVQENLNIERFFNPLPYNYTFELEIVTEYMIDITQILEQILPFFNPLNYIRITIPELTIGTDSTGSYPLDIKVVYEGASQESPTVIDEAEYRVLKWTLSFKVEGYLLKPKYDYPIITQTMLEYQVHTDAEPVVKTTTLGLSAEKYPLDVTTEELSGSLYDPEIKLLYKYERDGV